MIDKIASWIGYAVVISSCLFLIGLLLWLTYIIYDYYLKKLLGWKNMSVRKNIFYFIKHKEEIKEYIKLKSGGK